MKKAFTLIELLLYVSIIGSVILAMSVFFSVLQRQRVRSQVISEVENQLLAPMQIMTQMARNAQAIVSPGVGISSGSATLDSTIFSLASGAVTMNTIPLTSEKVVVSNLTFTNLSATSPGTLRIQYTVSYNNPGTMPEYTYSKAATGSATLR